MKKALVFLVVLFFAKPIFPLLDFAINYDAIQELCENRSRPELDCKGGCYLKKELAKSAESDDPYSNNKKQNTQELEILFFTKLDWQLDVPVLAVETKISDSYRTFYNYLLSSDSFKPPLV